MDIGAKNRAFSYTRFFADSCCQHNDVHPTLWLYMHFKTSRVGINIHIYKRLGFQLRAILCTKYPIWDNSYFTKKPNPSRPTVFKHNAPFTSAEFLNFRVAPYTSMLWIDPKVKHSKTWLKSRYPLSDKKLIEIIHDYWQKNLFYEEKREKPFYQFVIYHIRSK